MLRNFSMPISEPKAALGDDVIADLSATRSATSDFAVGDIRERAAVNERGCPSSV